MLILVQVDLPSTNKLIRALRSLTEHYTQITGGNLIKKKGLHVCMSQKLYDPVKS